MSVKLRDNAYFKNAKGEIHFIRCFTALTKFAFRDKWSGRTFDIEGKSSISPDYDLIEEAANEAPVLESTVQPPWAGTVVHFPDNKEVRALCVGVWCGELGLLVADVEAAGPEGPVKVRRAWLESEAGSIGLSDDFLETFALQRGKRGFVPALDLIASRAREEAWG